MSLLIKNINLKDEVIMGYRTVDLYSKRVQSININQTDGIFVTTEPLQDDGQIVVYPQSPNNENYEIQTYKSMESYGTLNLPLDARFDYIRRKMFIADAGNSRVLKLNINNYEVENEVKDILIPHSIIPEINIGGFFVKAFSGVNTGVIHYYNANGEVQDFFTYNCELGHSSTEVEYTTDYLSSLPLPSTMAYDHVRWRLWWTAGTYVYMIDVRNGQVIQNNLFPSYFETKGIEIEFETGNAFAIAKSVTNNRWEIVQIFRDNNHTFCGAWILKDEEE